VAVASIDLRRRRSVAGRRLVKNNRRSGVKEEDQISPDLLDLLFNKTSGCGRY